MRERERPLATAMALRPARVWQALVDVDGGGLAAAHAGRADAWMKVFWAKKEEQDDGHHE